MFMKTFKTSKWELLLLLLGLLCFAATLWYIVSPHNGVSRTAATPSQVTAAEKFLVNAHTAEQRAQFLAQFGWEIGGDPLLVRDVVIPASFDDAYTQYNELQKPLGFNLDDYRGCRVIKWVYPVTNYPGIPANVTATLLIRDGSVIGGDISSVGAKKFTHSLLLPAQQSE